MTVRDIIDWIGTWWINVDCMTNLPIIVRSSLILGVKRLCIYLVWLCLYLVCMLGGTQCLVDDLLNVFLVDVLFGLGLLVLFVLIAV